MEKIVRVSPSVSVIYLYFAFFVGERFLGRGSLMLVSVSWPQYRFVTFVILLLRAADNRRF